MSDRRRASRFMLTESDATLRVMQDVYVEETNATQITIVTDAPPAAGDEVLIELPPEDDVVRCCACAHRNARWSRMAMACVTGSSCRCCSGGPPASRPV